MIFLILTTRFLILCFPLHIYPKDLRLNKTNESDFTPPFLDLNLSIKNGIISAKIYDKRDDFDFAIVNYPHLDGDFPRATSYGVYISQLIRLLGPVPLLKISIFVIERSHKNFLNMVTYLINILEVLL